MFKTIIAVVIGVLITLGLLEQTLRVQTYGPVAFNPVKLDSMRLILNSDLIQPAESLDVYFELKPNLDTWHKGARMRTNSAGMRDQEYAKQKPDDVFRVALAGSSWTMATGVPVADAWHTLLENELQVPGKRVEALSFGVEMYGMAEITATAREKALDWDPDLLVVAITGATGLFQWIDHQEPFVVPAEAHPFRQSQLAARVARMTGRDLYADQVSQRPFLNSMDRASFLTQIERGLRDIHAVTAPRDVPVVVLWLGWRNMDKAVTTLLESMSEELGMLIVDANAPFDDGIERDYFDDTMYRPYYVSRQDKHGNAAAHRIIADTLLESLSAEPGFITPR